MPHRERTAWTWLAGLVVIFSIYFTVVILKEPAEPPFLERIRDLAIALGTLGVLALVTQALPRLTPAGREAAKMDERDRLIEYKAASRSYQVLIFGMILIGCIMPFTEPAWKIVNTALLAIAIAEATRVASVLLGYRRGFHA